MTTIANEIEVTTLKIRQLVLDDRYQRSHDDKQARSRIEQIKNDYNPHLMQPIEVAAHEDGEFAVVDGGHRFVAMSEKFGPNHDIVCRVHYGSTVADEASIFTQLQSKRKNIAPMDLFKADLISQVPDATMVQNVLSEFELKIARGSNSSGNITAVSALRRIAKRGRPELLRRVVRVLHDSWHGLDKAYWNKAINAIYALLLDCWEDVDDHRLIRTLQRFTPESINARITGGGLMANGGQTVSPWVLFIIREYNKNLRTNKISYRGSEG